MPATPLNRGKVELLLDSLSDEIEWDVSGDDWLTVDLAYGASTSAWPSSAIVVLERSGEGRNYKGFPTAITWTSIDPKDRMRITGATRVRLRVSTQTASAGKSLVATVTSTRERP